MEPMSTVLAKAATTGVARELIHLVTESLRRRFASAPNVWAWQESAIATHLQWVASWSSSVQIADMERSKAIETSTIQMDLSCESEHADFGDGSQMSSVATLLCDERSYLICGDPGGGKTTAMKQLCRKLLLEPERHHDRWQYPIVVLLRDLPRKSSLLAHIGITVGLQIEIPAGCQPGNVGRLVRCGSETLVQALAQTITSTRAVLLLDGLDEVDADDRRHVESDVQDLVHLLPNGKVILSV